MSRDRDFQPSEEVERISVWGRAQIDGEWSPLEQLSPITPAGPFAVTSLRGFCAVTMPDGFETSATADTDEAAARTVLENLKRHYGREFRLTWEERGILIETAGQKS